MTSPNNNTPISIIQDAYLDSGLIGVGQAVNSEQIVMGMRRLTDMINLWQTQGLKLWLNVDTPITLVAGTGTYKLGPAQAVDISRTCCLARAPGYPPPPCHHAVQPEISRASSLFPGRRAVSARRAA